MIENVYQMLLAAASVGSIVADRIYFGVAPQEAIQPYVVWNIISNIPVNSLACVPDIDAQRFQLDCYSLDPATARSLAQAVRDVIESEGYVVSGPVFFGVEADTGLSRWTLDGNFHFAR